MALNPSGPISLAGSTAGQSIAVELGLGETSQISLNCTNVRTLAGVPSGAIVMPTNFWGKSNFTPFGCATYTTAGTFSYVVPSGVTKICVVCVGSGGIGYGLTNSMGTGGGGGALSYTNCIPTTPGETLTVVNPQQPSGATPTSVSRGGTVLISAAGGQSTVAANSTSPGGQASAGVGSVRFSGGNGRAYGGGGAAGYSGNGANANAAPAYNVATVGNAGTGGSGGSGGSNASGINSYGGGGGGVGLVIAGASGAAGGSAVPLGGGGGSGGSPGVSGGTRFRCGGAYGGGAGGHYDSDVSAGAVAGVRIIWGTGKSYPNNSAP